MDKNTERKQIVSVSHYGRHADELTGEWIIEKIKGAGLIIGEYGRGSLKPVEECPGDFEALRRNVVFIGVAGGKFDDHVGKEEKRMSSSANLIAQALKLDSDPSLTWILSKVKQHDKEAIGYVFDLPSVVKSYNLLHPENDRDIRIWFYTALDTIREGQANQNKVDYPAIQDVSEVPNSFSALTHFFEEAERISHDDAALQFIIQKAADLDNKKLGFGFDIRTVFQTMEWMHPEKHQVNLEWLCNGFSWIYQDKRKFFDAVNEFPGCSRVEEIRGPRNEKLRLAIIQSDNERMHLVARSHYGCRAGVIIQKTSAGNVQLYTDHMKRIRLDEVVAILRYREAEKAGKKIYNWNTLGATGVLEEVPEWFLHEVKFMILNGALSAKNIPPTKLSLDEIMAAVKVGINPRLFDQQRSDACQKECSSTKKDQCPLYGCGLKRCRDKRREKYVK